MSVVFEEGTLGNGQTLEMENMAARAYVEEIVRNVSPDKRFVYYLMAGTGVCVVPLSGFNSHLHGFRLTLLEPDEIKFRERMETIASAIKEYLHS